MEQVCANCHHYSGGDCMLLVEWVKRRQAAAVFVLMDRPWQLDTRMHPHDGCRYWERRRKKTLAEHKTCDASKRAVRERKSHAGV